MIAGPLYLTILRYGDTVAMDLAEVDPVVPRSQIQIEERLLTEINEELARITTLANKETALQGSKAPTRVDLSRSALGALQRLGGLIYSHLFPAPARRRLAEIGSTDVFLRLDDQLVHVPWELAFDGRDFLLSKFRIGRQVISQQPPMLRSPREVKYRARLKMLIVVDPTESLPNAVEEADQICELLEACDNLEVSVISGKQLRKIDLLQALNECDIVHYAGHAVFDPQQPNNSGWVLHDAVLTASEISRVPHPPFLVFSNACQAGATTRWQPDAIYQGQAFGIGSAFLLAGTQNYIGTFCVIYDAYSAAFAANFYRHLLQGERLGAALSAARRGAGHDAGRNGLLWASYVHYGNPTFGLPLAPTTGVSALDRWPHAMPDPALEMAASAIDECAPPPRGTGDLEAPGQAHQSAESRRASTRDTPLPSHESTGSEAQVRREGRRAHARSRWLALGTTVLLGLIVIATIWSGGLFSLRIPEERSWLTEAYQALDRGDFSGAGALFQRLADGADTRMKSQGYAGLAAVAFARRDYQQALGLVEQAERLDPEISYSHVLRGHVLWNQGKLAEAAAEYQLAVSKPRAIPWQQAIAHDRLGRIYAARGDAQNALDHYDKAIVSHQQMAAVHANKGHLLEQLGRRQEALALYRRALQVNPDDALTVVLLRDAEYREQLAQDRERQQRIDQLIAELVQAYREGRGSELPSDAWTSTPLSIAVLPIQPQGPPSPRAGREELALTTLVESLRASDRMTVVERAFLDQLLAELKLGSSILADPVGALRLGRILAARLTATGRLIRLGDTEQLSIRLIETETTRTVAAATEMLDAPENLDTPVKRLVQVILTRVRQQYPLQGRIVDVTPQGMTLNIGALQGVTPGLVMGVFREGVLDAPVGRVEVISVEAQSSRARVLEQSAAFQRDWQVREESQ